MIPFVAFQREPEALKAEMRAAFERVLESGHWVLGPEVEAFETAWATRCGVAHAVGTANGLEALEIALRTLSIGPGAEVITTPMTALATVLSITRAGAAPVLADIDPRTGLLDVASAERCISPRTRAIIPVHLYGNGSAAPAWSTFASRHELALIEDCAQAHLATVDGRPIGSFGQVGAFSFYPTKNLGAIGDAGALVTSNPGVAERARMLRNYGQKDRYHHEVAGMNSRLDELQAALLRARMGRLEGQTDRRRAVADRYRSGIHNAAVALLEAPSDPAAHVHHLFVVLCADRDALRQHLEERGVSSLVHYPVPAHRQTPYLNIQRDPEGLRQSEQFASQCLSVPCHGGLRDDEVAQVIDAVNSFRIT